MRAIGLSSLGRLWERVRAKRAAKEKRDGEAVKKERNKEAAEKASTGETEDETEEKSG